MTARIRSKSLTVAALVAALALAGCGGSDSSSDKGGGADKPPAGDKAQDRKDIARLIKQGFGRNEKARSGKINGTIDLEVKGVPRYKGPIEATASGGFELRDGADVPDLNIDVGLVLNDSAIGGTLVVADSKAYVALGTTGYRIPDAISAKIVAPARTLDNGLAKSAGMFYIRPDRWQRNGRIVGDETVDGVVTEHATAEIDAKAFFEDLSRLTRLLTLLRVTEAVGLPQAIGPQARAALVRSVKSAKGDVYIGKEDHVLRKAHLEGELVVAKKDRAILGAMTSATLSADVNITDIGAPQKIGAPKQLGSYDDLQLSLDALGEGIRNSQRGR